MFDADEMIGKLLSASEAVDVAFDNGETTTLVPSRFVPPLDGDQHRVSLNGTWRVVRWPFEADEAELASPETPDEAWEELAQPGKVLYADPEVCPDHVPNWNRVKLDHIHADDGAVLRRRVTVPADWAGKRVLLRFGSIYPAGRLYVNGELVGEHLSGLTPVEWDVTGLVSPGEPALVAVRLLRKHEFVDLDMPRHALEFAGLAQDACFHAVEPCHVADYHLVSELDDSFARGTVRGSVTVAQSGGSVETCRVSITLTDPQGVEAARDEQTVQAGPGGSTEATFALDAGRVEPWSDESPALYTVTIRLEAGGQADQETSFRTGFRRLELAPAGARLNGGFIKFRGVNHLTFHPRGGLYTPADWLRRCLTLMKHANVNCIRTHFLSPPALVDLCDEMGIYLMQELPIDWASDRVVTRHCLGPAMMRLEGGLRRDRHHPSIMAWSVGNESLPTEHGDPEIFWSNMKLFDRLAKTLSPDKATMFPPPGPANKIDGIFETRVGDIGDTHYSFKYARQLAATGATARPRSWRGDYETRSRDELLAEGWSGVWFSSEWGIFNYLPDVLHGPYLSVISDRGEDPVGGKGTLEVFEDRFEADWSAMRDDPTCLGGAYFPWMSAGSGDPWGWTLWGEDANWGVVTQDLLPKPAFWALRVAYNPVRLPDRIAWKPGQDALRFQVRSLYHRTDLSQCTFRTMLGGGPPWMATMREWKDIPIACPPGGSAEVAVPIWNAGSRQTLDAGRPIVCRCIVLDPTGYRPITHDILVLPEAAAGGADAAMPIGPDAEL